jgi:hypothetical protein
LIAVAASSTNESTAVAITVAPATLLRTRPLLCSPISSRLLERRQRKKSVIGVKTRTTAPA